MIVRMTGAAPAALIAALLAAPQDTAAVAPNASGVPGAPEAPENNEADEAPDARAAMLDARWRPRLEESDLVAREESFARLIDAARRNAAVVELLQSWSTEGTGELAWTARLALRELHAEAEQGPRLGTQLRLEPWFFEHDPQGGDPLEFHDPLAGGLQFFDPAQVWGLRDDGALSTSERVTLQQGPDGVHCEVHHHEDGREVTETYDAESIEALLAEHPDLEGKLPLAGGGPRALAPREDMRRAFDRWFGSLAGEADIRTDVLGVFVHALTASETQALGLEQPTALYVERVEPGTIADSLGLRPGTVLLELNGRPLLGTEDISLALAAREPHGEVRLLVLDREGLPRMRVWRPAPGVDAGAPEPPEFSGPPEPPFPPPAPPDRGDGGTAPRSDG